MPQRGQGSGAKRGGRVSSNGWHRGQGWREEEGSVGEMDGERGFRGRWEELGKGCPRGRVTELQKELWSPCEGQERSGRHPKGRGVLGGKYEVEVGSQNEMLTGKRREV